MSAEKHDVALSYVSHLPQLISTALAGMSNPEHVELCGSGFRGLIRLAASSYSIWESIFATNRDNIDKALEDFMEHIQLMRSALRDKGLAEEFSRAAKVFKLANRRR